MNNELTITINSKFARTPIVLDKNKILIKSKDENGQFDGKYFVKSKVNIFTKIEFKFFLGIISRFNPLYPSEDLTYTFEKDEFLSQLNIGKNLTSEEINQILKSINRYNVEFSAVGEDNKGTVSNNDYHINMFPTASYSKSTGRITIRLNPDFARYFWTGTILKDKTKILEDYSVKNLNEHYFSFNLSSMEGLKSPYSMRLYLYFKSLSGYKKNEILLNNLLHLLGVDINEFEYKTFNRNILKKAIKEINETTDIKINIEEIRKNRKVYKLSFNIENIENIEDAQSSSDESNEGNLDEDRDIEANIDNEINEKDSGKSGAKSTWKKYLGKMSIEDKICLNQLLDIYFPYQIGKAILDLNKDNILSKEKLVEILNSKKYGDRIENEYSKRNKNKKENKNNKREISLKNSAKSGDEMIKALEEQLGSGKIVDFDKIFN